jgi:hypothetical protein
MTTLLSHITFKTTSRTLNLTLLIVIALFALSACGGGAATTGAQSYIATVEGAPTSARVGIVVEEGKFAAYVCSLDDGFNLTSSRWYSGTVDANGNVQGVSPDGVEFKGTIQNNQFTGTLVNTEKVTWNFKGSLVPAGGAAGLYRGTGQYNGKDIVVGSVISTDGSFAATAEYKGKIEFVAPVAGEPASQSANTVVVKIGPTLEQFTVTLVTTLKGVEF